MSARDPQSIADRFGIPVPDQVLHLDQVGGLMRRIAEAVVRERGYYTCTQDGLRTVVLAKEVAS